MQFHVDDDTGDSVSGWVLPDNPSATPTILVFLLNRETARFQANIFRQDLKDLGVHHTGMVGFRVDRSVVPDLKASDEIEIRDADTDIPIFRRFRADRHLPMKVMRFEPNAMPQLPLNSSFAEHFALTYNAVERHPFDTLFAIINNQSASSIYLSGRPYLTRYLQLLRDRGFKTAMLLRNPIDELAERLVFLKFAASEKRPDFVLNHLTDLRPLMAMSARLNFKDDNDLASTMNALNDEERAAISNPYVRLLACAADEIADNSHVSIALENLANLDLVGVQDRFEGFRHDLNAILQVDVIGNQTPAVISNVPVIAQKLGRLRSVHKMLALDMKLYRYVSEAVAKTYEQS